MNVVIYARFSSHNQNEQSTLSRPRASGGGFLCLDRQGGAISLIEIDYAILS